MRASEERTCWVCAWVYLRILRDEGTCSSVRLEYESLYIFEQSSCQCEVDAYLFTSRSKQIDQDTTVSSERGLPRTSGDFYVLLLSDPA